MLSYKKIIIPQENSWHCFTIYKVSYLGKDAPLQSFFAAAHVLSPEKVNSGIFIQREAILFPQRKLSIQFQFKRKTLTLCAATKM